RGAERLADRRARRSLLRPVAPSPDRGDRPADGRSPRSGEGATGRRSERPSAGRRRRNPPAGGGRRRGPLEGLDRQDRRGRPRRPAGPPAPGGRGGDVAPGPRGAPGGGGGRPRGGRDLPPRADRRGRTVPAGRGGRRGRESTPPNSRHVKNSYAGFWW